MSASCGAIGGAERAYQHALSVYQAGGLKEAEKLAEAGETQLRGQTNSPWLHRFRLLRAESLSAQGNNKAAAAFLTDAIPMAQLEARRKIDVAQTLLTTPERAMSWLQQATSEATDTELKIRIRNLEGLLAMRKNPIDKVGAIAAYRDTIRMAADAKMPYYEALALSNLSHPLKRDNQMEESIAVGLKALAIAEKLGYKRVAAIACGNVGSTYMMLNNIDAAREYNQRAVRLNEETGDKVNLAVSLGELGVTESRADDYEKAISYYDRAYRLAVELGQKVDAERMCENRAAAHMMLSQWDQATEWNERSLQLAAELKRTVPLPIRNRAFIARGKGDMAEAKKWTLELLNMKDLPVIAYQSAYGILASVAMASKQYDEAKRQYELAIHAIEADRNSLTDVQNRLTLLTRSVYLYESYVDLLVSLNDDANALRVAEMGRARVLAEHIGREVQADAFPGPAALQKFAAANRLSLLAFWTGPDRSFAWLITGKGVRRFQLPPSPEITKMVKEYTDVASHSVRDPKTIASPLWNAVMAAVAAEIPKGTRVIAIPSGALHRVNLETLIVPTPTPHYWIEDVELAVAPSLGIAISAPPQAAATQSALLIGAPDYKGSDYPPLPSADGELRDVASRYPETMLRTGANATPAAYFQSNPDRFALIHFAAHAESNEAAPLSSSIVLSGGGQKIYAREVTDVPIHASLVTLSACRSAGVRTYHGEGLIGLAWAFLNAGARSVVAGLWDVSDSSSAPLMQQFYQRFTVNGDPVQSLREAKLAIMKDKRWERPFYWGPFQVYLRTATR